MFRYEYIVPRTDVLVKRRFILNLTEEVFSQKNYKDTRICKNALASGLEVAIQIIDKYKAEIEPKESEV